MRDKWEGVKSNGFVLNGVTVLFKSASFASIVTTGVAAGAEVSDVAGDEEEASEGGDDCGGWDVKSGFA